MVAMVERINPRVAAGLLEGAGEKTLMHVMTCTLLHQPLRNG